MGALMSRRALGLVLATLVWLVPSRVLAQSETTEYYGLDTTGSVRVVFDAAGTVLTRVDYGPFGEQLAAASGAPNEKYAGLFRDDETGLDYAQARQYNPRIGRFTSLDPVYSGLFEPQRWNRYAYALNSPLVFSDPSGAETQTVNCGLGTYWCPGAIQSGKDGDKYFDPQQYGYQGGEESARAEAAYALNVTVGFLDKAATSLQKKSSQQSNGSATISTSERYRVEADGKTTYLDGANALDALADAGGIAGPMAKPVSYAWIIGGSAAVPVIVQFLPSAFTLASSLALTPGTIYAVSQFIQGTLPSPPSPTPAGYVGMVTWYYVGGWVENKAASVMDRAQRGGRR